MKRNSDGAATSCERGNAELLGGLQNGTNRAKGVASDQATHGRAVVRLGRAKTNKLHATETS
jgi:hypothetical protein